MDLEAELDRLYRGPAADFVAGRSKLVSELRRSGDRASAERISKLARPTPVAWAVNQLHFHAPKVLGALRETGSALRRAQESPGDEDFAETNRAHQKALQAAVDRALALLEGGASQNASLKRRLELTLNLFGAAPEELDPPPGRMSVELEPVGFDAFTSVAAPVARAPTKRDKGPEHAEQTKKLEAVKDALDAADKEVRRLEREAERADARYERAVRDTEEVESRAEQAREAQRLAKESVAEAKTQLEAARRELHDAKRALEDLPK